MFWRCPSVGKHLQYFSRGPPYSPCLVSQFSQVMCFLPWYGGHVIHSFPCTPSQKRLKISNVGTISHKKWADTYINCLLFSIRVRISDGVISHNIDSYLWLSWIFFSFKCIIFFSTTSLNQQDDWLHLYNLQCFCDRSILQPSETYQKMWEKKKLKILNAMYVESHIYLKVFWLDLLVIRWRKHQR